MKEIDAVITWVDGNDPSHIAKRKKYGSNEIFNANDVAGSTRFNNLGEIFWCIASLNRFASFLHKIYLVTDEQNPHLESFLEKNFPQGHIPIEIIDHKTIFRGYEEYLPTFNSITLETMTWRIPGLSENYIEFNDDLMLASPISPEDFFTEDGKVICYASKYSQLWTWLTRKLKRKVHGRTKVTFKRSMMNGARLAGEKSFFYKLHHTPKGLNRVFFEKYFKENPEEMIRNIKYRFRNAEQFTPQELQYISLDKMGKCKRLPIEGNLFFLQPKKRKGYVHKKLEKLKKNKSYKFCCFNSLDWANDSERKSILSWIEERLQIKLD